MRKAADQYRGQNHLPVFEKLENREMFSASPLFAESLTAAQQAAPAALIAAAVAKKPPKVQAIVSQSGTGLTGEYFTDSNFKNGTVLLTDATVNEAPAKKDPTSLTANSVRWTGQIAPSYTELYSFTVIAKGGVRLWVNGQLMIDQAASAGGNLRSPLKIDLVAGQKYTLTLEYTRRSAAGVGVKLLWASLHQKQGIIPQKALFADPTASLPATSAGLIGQYYTGKNFDKLVMDRIDPTINFVFGSKTPTFLIPAGSPYSIRWTGQIVPQYSQTYTFTTNTDDGMRLYVDDQLLINDFVDHSVKIDTAQITLIAGQAYDIRMDYYENKGVATAELKWSSPSQALEVVPATALSSTPAASAGNLISTVVSSTSISLTWTGSVSATGYLVQESTDGGVTYSTIAATPANQLAYTVNGLNPATLYMFRIAPLGSTDTSTPSPPSIVGTATDSPAAITATPASSTTTVVNWSDVAGENGFAVYQASSNSGDQTASVTTRSLFAADVIAPGFTQIGTVGAGVTQFTATGLNPGSQYQFLVKSINAAGILSDSSSIATALTPPVAPVQVSDSNPLTNAVVLNWVDVPAENGFAIDRSFTGTDEWTQIGSTLTGVTTYTDSTVSPGTDYSYRIRSLNAGGSSDPSSILQAVTAVNAPTNVVTSATTAVGTVLNWADVAGEDGFAILESSNGGNSFSQVGITPAGVTTFPVIGLTPGTSYQFEVQALNSAAAKSVPSTVASVITTTIAPVTLTATGLSTTTANIVWSDVAGETGFVLQRSPDGVTGWTTIATPATGVLSYTDSALSPGTNYFYQVLATNAGGASAASIAATALTIPAAPVAALTGLSVAQSSVSWNAVTGASQYLVQRSLNGTSGWTTAATAAGSSLSATVANLAASTLYYYRVTAVNATGSSTPSTTVTQTSAPLAEYALHNVIYGTTAAGSVYSVNVQNGTATIIGQLPVIPTVPTRNPFNGVMYYFQAGTSNVYSWDPATGNSAMVNTSIISSPIVRGAYRSDGTGFTIAQDDKLRSVPANGTVATVIGTVTFGGTPLSTTAAGSMAFSENNVLFMTIGATLYTVDTTTAVATPIASTLLGNPLMVFGPGGMLYMTNGNGNLYSVNPLNAVSSLLGNDNLPSFTGLAAVPLFTHLNASATSSPSLFTKGQNATYTVTVTNTTGDSTTQPVTVTTTLPTGLTFVSVTTNGWTASANGQTVTFSYAAGVVAGNTLPPLNVTVAVGSNAPALVTTQFTATSSELDGNTTSALETATVVSVVV